MIKIFLKEYNSCAKRGKQIKSYKMLNENREGEKKEGGEKEQRTNIMTANMLGINQTIHYHIKREWFKYTSGERDGRSG